MTHIPRYAALCAASALAGLATGAAWAQVGDPADPSGTWSGHIRCELVFDGHKDKIDTDATITISRDVYDIYWLTVVRDNPIFEQEWLYMGYWFFDEDAKKGTLGFASPLMVNSSFFGETGQARVELKTVGGKSFDATSTVLHIANPDVPGSGSYVGKCDWKLTWTAP